MKANVVCRRHFLEACGAWGALAAVPPAWADDVGPSVFGKPVGLQLYSLRQYMPKDVAGTLAKIRAMGFREIEGGDDYKLGLDGWNAAVARAGLQGHEHPVRLRGLGQGPRGHGERAAVALRRALQPAAPGSPTRSASRGRSALQAAADFNRAGRAAREAGLKFVYHIHGFEFEPSPEGTLFDTLGDRRPIPRSCSSRPTSSGCAAAAAIPWPCSSATPAASPSPT